MNWVVESWLNTGQGTRSIGDEKTMYEGAFIYILHLLRCYGIDHLNQQIWLGGTSFGFHQSGSSCLIEATSMHSNTSNTKVICFRTRLRFTQSGSWARPHHLVSNSDERLADFFHNPASCQMLDAWQHQRRLLSVRGVNYPTANIFSAAYQQKLQVKLGSDEIWTLSIMNHGHGMTRDLHKLGSQEHQSELHLIFPFISLHYHYYFLHLNLTSSHEVLPRRRWPLSGPSGRLCRCLK